MKQTIQLLAKYFVFALLLLFTGAPSLAADATAQSIAINYKQDIFTEDGYEAACVSLQLGTMLSMNGASVTLFPSLDGVRIAHTIHLAWADAIGSGVENITSGVGNWTCTTNQGSTSLTNVVNGFINAGGKILVCPLCWYHRYANDENATLINGATMGEPGTISELFLGADKVIDF